MAVEDSVNRVDKNCSFECISVLAHNYAGTEADNHNQNENRFHMYRPSKSRMWCAEDGRSREARSGSVYVSSTHSSSSGVTDLGGVGTVGPSVASPLRVVMALSSPFGLATVLSGRYPDPEVEAVFIYKRLAIMFLISLVWLYKEV
nr:hypothetical protein [Tanacetum cinerariifolium]